MAAATATGKEIRQGLSEIVGGWVYLGAATAASNVAYIIDTERLQGVNLPASLFDNAIVRISSGTYQGETANVDHLDAINGYLYLTPSLTGALASGDTYEIWLRGIDPDYVDRLRDDCLSRFCSTWRPTALTDITDGDMQDSGVTSWSVASGATRTKVYPSFPDAHYYRALQVVHTTASTDFVQTASIYVNPGERYFLQVPVSAWVTATPGLAATASLVIADVQNAVALTQGGIKTTHIGKGQGWISILFTIPANCYEIRIKLYSDTNASTTEWGPFYMHKRGKTRKSLPDRITTKKRVGNFFTLTNVNPAQSEQADNMYKNNKLGVSRVQVGSQVEVNFDQPLGEQAVMYMERGFFPRLSASYFTIAARATGDAAATLCPKEYIVAALAERVAKFYMDIFGADWQDDWVRASTELAYWEGEFGPEPQWIEETDVPVMIPQIQV